MTTTTPDTWQPANNAYEPDDARYERYQDELEAFELSLDPAALYPCSLSDDGPAVYCDTDGTWHYRTLARFQRSHFNLRGTGSVAAEFAATILTQCLVAAIARAAVERYEAMQAVIQNTVQRAMVDSGKVKQAVYEATHGHARELFPTRHRETTDERHTRRVKLWGWQS